jgi:hypothetical protein
VKIVFEYMDSVCVVPGFSEDSPRHVLWTLIQVKPSYTIAYVGPNWEQTFIAYVGPNWEQTFMGWWICTYVTGSARETRFVPDRAGGVSDACSGRIYKHEVSFAEKFRFPFTDVLATHVLVGFILTTFLAGGGKVSFGRPVILDAFHKNLKTPLVSVRRFTMVRKKGKTVMMNESNADADEKVSDESNDDMDPLAQNSNDELDPEEAVSQDGDTGPSTGPSFSVNEEVEFTKKSSRGPGATWHKGAVTNSRARGITLEYEIGYLGPSGVKTVKLWVPEKEVRKGPTEDEKAAEANAPPPGPPEFKKGDVIEFQDLSELMDGSRSTWHAGTITVQSVLRYGTYRYRVEGKRAGKKRVMVFKGVLQGNIRRPTAILVVATGPGVAAAGPEVAGAELANAGKEGEDTSSPFGSDLPRDSLMHRSFFFEYCATFFEEITPLIKRVDELWTLITPQLIVSITTAAHLESHGEMLREWAYLLTEIGRKFELTKPIPRHLAKLEYIFECCGGMNFDSGQDSDDPLMNPTKSNRNRVFQKQYEDIMDKSRKSCDRILPCIYDLSTPMLFERMHRVLDTRLSSGCFGFWYRCVPRVQCEQVLRLFKYPHNILYPFRLLDMIMATSFFDDMAEDEKYFLSSNTKKMKHFSLSQTYIRRRSDLTDDQLNMALPAAEYLKLHINTRETYALQQTQGYREMEQRRHREEAWDIEQDKDLTWAVCTKCQWERVTPMDPMMLENFTCDGNTDGFTQKCATYKDNTDYESNKRYHGFDCPYDLRLIRAYRKGGLLPVVVTAMNEGKFIEVSIDFVGKTFMPLDIEISDWTLNDRKVWSQERRWEQGHLLEVRMKKHHRDMYEHYQHEDSLRKQQISLSKKRQKSKPTNPLGLTPKQQKNNIQKYHCPCQLGWLLDPLASEAEQYFRPPDNLGPCDERTFAFANPPPVLDFADSALWHIVAGFNCEENNSERMKLRNHLEVDHDVPEDKLPFSIRGKRGKNVKHYGIKQTEAEKKREEADKKKEQRNDVEQIRMKIRHVVSASLPFLVNFSKEAAAVFVSDMHADDDKVALKGYSLAKVQLCFDACSIKPLLDKLSTLTHRNDPDHEAQRSIEKLIIKLHNLITWYARNELTACVLRKVVELKHKGEFGPPGCVTEVHSHQIDKKHVWDGGDPDMIDTLGTLSWLPADFERIKPPDLALAKQIGESWVYAAMAAYSCTTKSKKARKRKNEEEDEDDAEEDESEGDVKPKAKKRTRQTVQRKATPPAGREAPPPAGRKATPPAGRKATPAAAANPSDAEVQSAAAKPANGPLLAGAAPTITHRNTEDPAVMQEDIVFPLEDKRSNLQVDHL